MNCWWGVCVCWYLAIAYVYQIALYLFAIFYYDIVQFADCAMFIVWLFFLILSNKLNKKKQTKKKGLNWMFPHGMAMLYIFSPIFLKRKFMHFRWNWKINVMENTCIVSPQIFFLRSVKMLRHGLIFRSFTLSSVIYLNRHTIGTISITDTQPTEQHSVINDHSQTIKHVKTLQLPARDYFFLICVRSGTLLRRNCFSGGQF